jgi:lysozyme
MRQMTARGYDFLIEQEGERLFSYDDATGKRINPGDIVRGVLTIGVGHTGPDVFPGQTITKEESRALFDKDTDWAEAVVDQNMVGPAGEKPNDNQFNACVSLAFNIGKAAFAGSSVVRNWKAGKFKEAGDAIGLWNRDKFGVNSALVSRRARETAMFFEPMQNELPKPMPQSVQPPPGATSSKSVWTNVGVASGAVTLAASNMQPALDAVNTAVQTAKSAQGTWASVKDLLGSLANGHVYTVVITALITVGAVYLIRRVFRRVKSGEITP